MQCKHQQREADMAAYKQTNLMASKYWKEIDYTERRNVSSFLESYHFAFNNF